MENIANFLKATYNKKEDCKKIDYSYENGNDNSSGSGYGSGYGSNGSYGYGSGVSCDSGNISTSFKKVFELNKDDVYLIDGILTIINKVRNNIALCNIVEDDLQLTKSFVIRDKNYYSHGKTIKEAFENLQEKINNNLTVEERISRFKKQFPILSNKYSAKDLFAAHNLLTGSCLQGREIFCKNNKIDINSDLFTIYEFIKLTKNAYQGDIIAALLD